MGSTIFSGDKVATLKDKLAVGKDTTAPQIINSTTNPTTSAVSAPLGSLLINRSTGEYYKKLDSGSSTNWELLSAGGAGGINYIKNPDFEVGTADTSVSTGCSVAVQTTNKLRGTQSLEVTFANTATSTSYVGIDMSDLDPQDVGKNLWVSFDYSEDGNMAADDYEVVLYNNDNSTEELVVGEFLPTGALTNRSRFVGRVSAFETVANSDYEIRIRSTVSRSTTSVLHIDNVRVAPDALVPGAIVTEWKDFTPTGGWSGAVTYTGKWRRVGDTMQVMSLVTCSAPPTGTTLTFNLPSGYTIDTSKIVAADSDKAVFGWGNILEAGSTSWPAGNVGYVSTTAVRVTVPDTGATHTRNAVVTNTVPLSFDANDTVSVFYTVPISGWSSGAMLSTTETHLLTPYVSCRRNTTGQTINTTATTVVWNGANENNFNMLDTSTGIITIPSTGRYDFIGSMRIDTGGTAPTQFIVTLDVNSGTRQFTLVAETDLAINKVYNFGLNYGSLNLAKGDVVKITAQSSGTASTMSVQSYMGVAKQIDPSVFSVYGDYELLVAQSSTTAGVTSGAYILHTGNGITLTPGTWQINGNGIFTRTSGTSNAIGYQLVWSETQNTFTALGTTSTTIVDYQSSTTPSFLGYNNSPQLDNYRPATAPLILTLTATDTIYLNSIIQAATAPTNFTSQVTILARRLK